MQLTPEALNVGLWLVSALAGVLFAVLVATANVSGRSRSEWAVATGLLFLSLVSLSVLACGLVHQLGTKQVALVHLLALAVVCAVYGQSPRLRATASERVRRLLEPPAEGWDGWLAAIAVLVVLLAAAECMRVTASGSDAMWLHLPLAASWVTNHGLQQDELFEWSRTWYQQAAANLGFAWMMLGARSAVLVPLWSVCWMALGAVALYRMGRMCRVPQTMALLPACLFVSGHEIRANVQWHYVDAALAGAQLCALLAVITFVRRPCVFWAVIAGLTTGIVAGTKPQAVLYAGVVVTALAVGLRSGRRRAGSAQGGTSQMALLIFALAILPLGGYWFTRPHISVKPIPAGRSTGTFGSPSTLVSGGLPGSILREWHQYFVSPAVTRRLVTSLSERVTRITALVCIPTAVPVGVILMLPLLRRRRAVTWPERWGAMIGLSVVMLLALYIAHPRAAVFENGSLRPGTEIRYGLALAGLAGLAFFVLVSRVRWLKSSGPAFFAAFALLVPTVAIHGKAVALAVLALAVVVFVAQSRRAIARAATSRWIYAAAVPACLVVAIAGRPVHAKLERAQEKYFEAVRSLDTYSGSPAIAWTFQHMPELPPGARIVCIGHHFVFPFFGKDLLDRPILLPAEPPDATGEAGRRADWLRKLVGVRPDYMVCVGSGESGVPEATWVRSLPAVFVALEQTNDAGWYRVDARALAALSSR